ncbi:MAG TPA: VWA domain-containing protein [Chitinophagaceae bacterium]|nr:VWA domain-containing protein [Chitinophagaceae bacterium]
MRVLLRFAALFLFLSWFGVASAQEKPSAKIPRVLFLLDGSSSMAEDWTTGRSRFQQAGRFILALVDSLSKANDEVEFGLRVFGHQYPAQQKNCYDTKLEIKFSRYNTVQMQARLEALHGYGVSPIAYSLSEAAMEDFGNENKYAYSIVLVTDGGESCDGDICKVVNDLLQRKIFFRPYIVSLVDYAPLRDLYRCLGTFLTVSEERGMVPAISKITDAHREGFIRAKTGTVIPVMPEVKKQDPPPAVVKEESKKPVEAVKRDTTPVPPAIKQDPRKIVVPVKKDSIIPPAKIVEEPPKPKLQERDRRVFNMIKLKTQLKTFKTIVIDPPTPDFIPVPPFRMVDVGGPPPAPVERKKESSFLPLRNHQPKIVRTVAQPKPRSVPVPPFVMVKLKMVPETTAATRPGDTIVIPITIKQDPKPVIKPVVKPTEKPVVKKADATYVVEKSPSQETMVEIYFTDGNGKFYSTTPQILFTNPNTNAPAHKFYRTVDPDGNPDPVKSPSGSFNISVVGSDRTFLKSVEIAANMKNKVVITVSGGSLQFVWKDGDKRPVSQYYAVVKRNFVPQPMVRQQCDTVMPYPPGNYHIEINTLPVSVRSTDLTFGATTTIQVDKPGKMQVTNTNNLGKVTFYYSHGDRFVQFHQMMVSGNPSSQTLELLPGPYEVHFFLGSGLPEKIKRFAIRANESTILELE